jgi:hypothetical protein
MSGRVHGGDKGGRGGASVAAVPTPEGEGQLRYARWPTITLEQLTLLLNTLADLIPGWQRLGPEIKRWHDCFIGALHLA